MAYARTLVSAMAAGWTAEETRALVSVWSQSNVQNHLDVVTRNRIVFEKIAKEMAELGFERTWQQEQKKDGNLNKSRIGHDDKILYSARARAAERATLKAWLRSVAEGSFSSVDAINVD